MVEGHVAIGLPSPAHALDVVGDAHVSGSFIAGNTTTYGDGSIVMSGTDLGVTGGDVGVGTSSPLVRLHAQGTSAGITGDGGSNIMFGDGAGIRNEIGFRSQSDSNNRVFHKVAINNSGDNTTVMTLMGSGNVGIGITAPAHALDVVGDAHVSGSFISGNTTTYADGSITLSGPTTSLGILGGNFGVGTTSPVTTFLAGSPTGISTILADVRGWINLPRDAGITAEHPSQGGRPVLWTDLDGTYIRNWDSEATDGIHFQSFDGTERMFIQENGGVGIGTTNTTSISNGTLFVSPGHVVVDNNFGLFSVNNSSSGIGAGIDTGIDDSLIFFAGGGDRGRVTPAGNFGFGTSSPDSTVDIQQDPRSGVHASGKALYVTGTFGSGQSYDGGIEFRHSNGTQGIGFGFNTIFAAGSNPNQPLALLSRGSDPITLNAVGGGDVGIGTLSPEANLHVGGQEAPSSTTGSVSRLAIQPYGHTGARGYLMPEMLVATLSWTSGTES